VSITIVWGSKTATIFFNSILFDGKVNLVGEVRKKNFKFPIVFNSTGKNNIKIREKWEFLHKTGF